jgi:hypothetical protein
LAICRVRTVKAAGFDVLGPAANIFELVSPGGGAPGIHRPRLQTEREPVPPRAKRSARAFPESLRRSTRRPSCSFSRLDRRGNIWVKVMTNGTISDAERAAFLASLQKLSDQLDVMRLYVPSLLSAASKTEEVLKDMEKSITEVATRIAQ